MKNITSRQFRLFADYMDVYSFMRDIYEKDWRNGVPAPFLEYAYSSFSYWMDLSYSFKNRIWEDNGTIVGFCFYENPVTDVYFSLRPGYEELASEMIDYADTSMPRLDGRLDLVLFQGQEALLYSAKQAGYRQVSKSNQMVLDLDRPIDFSLPEGYHFIDPHEYDMDKVSECCYKGFDHEDLEGPWNHQHLQNNYLLQSAPHATPYCPVAIADQTGEYACWAGMWWVPENHLAYLEPLCTIPRHRHRGLASAALSELCRKMKSMGATHMTGGNNNFYQKIGFKSAVTWTFWEKVVDQ